MTAKMLQDLKDIVVLLRIPFSFFLLPIYLFAISQAPELNTLTTLSAFFILHFLVYPASNGYNSYIDRDSESIGSLKKPPPPPQALGMVTLLMDVLAVSLSLLINIFLAWGILIFILASRAYSSPWPRLKKYPLLSFLTVFTFQGGWTFFTVLFTVTPFTALHLLLNMKFFYMALGASFIIGGSYPLSQIYQHESDKNAGDLTLSLQLGYRNTLLFSASMFTLAILILGMNLLWFDFMILMICLTPVLLFFFNWSKKVWNSPLEANFNNTMKMNIVSSLCLSVAFGLMLSI